jgi:hypothetical protein
MKARLDRLGRDGQVTGGLLDAHLLDVAHDEDDAECLGEIVDGAFEQTPYLRPRRRALRIPGRV